MSRIARTLFALLLIVTFLATPAAALRESGGATAVSSGDTAEAPSSGILVGLWNWIQSLFDEEHGTIVPKP